MSKILNRALSLCGELVVVRPNQGGEARVYQYDENGNISSGKLTVEVNSPTDLNDAPGFAVGAIVVLPDVTGFNVLINVGTPESSSFVTLGTLMVADGGSIFDTSYNELLKFVSTASAINELTVTNAATGSSPSLSATGGDTDINAELIGKGKGSLQLGTGTRTATATAGAATLSKESGVITSEALTTAAGAAYTLTLTNTKITAADQVYVSVANGTNSAGVPVVSTVTEGSNGAIIVIQNEHSADAFNGTLKIKFSLLK